ncbi:unnamed protein product [Microthlaspi erraticum]|uniref:Pectin acetylesterase n=1 Tax=Microthlaspi erraticum TaxID=1685480 RepID=A0A6D2JWQ7_9BRAS|nr:unnamed protein product [Microthlaspi erraticum]
MSQLLMVPLTLIHRAGPKGAGRDFEILLLLSGCSAGGLASILHCDQFKALLPGATKVKCLSDAGLFMDAYVIIFIFDFPSSFLFLILT